MAFWELPTSTVINGREFSIRADFRDVLNVITVLEDVELTDSERGRLAFEIFYPEYDTMTRADVDEAAEFLKRFIAGGELQTKTRGRKLADWKQDFPIIISPVNKVLGYEARAREFVHWWTFLAAYLEVGECLFAHVVNIRKKRAEGKRLTKDEQKFYRENIRLIEIKREETEEEKAFFDEWLV